MNYARFFTYFWLSILLFSCSWQGNSTVTNDVVIKVSDYNVIAGVEDVTQPLKNAISAAKKRNANKLVFEPGIYHFKSATAMADYDLLMSSKLHFDTPWGLGAEGYNKSISFNELNNLTIDGQGSTLVFHGLTQAIELISSHNITLQNFTIKWQRPLFSIGTVLIADGNTVSVEFDDIFPVVGGEPVWAYMDYNPQTKKLGVFDDWRIKEPMTFVSPQVLSFKSDRKLPVGHRLIVRHVGNYRPAIHLVNTQNIHFENVTILSAPGMGVIGHNCHNVSFNKLSVKPEKDHLMSTNTDATHFISCTGEISIKNSYFEGMGDDATNVHGFYLSIKKIIDQHNIVAYLEANTQDHLVDIPAVGDKMEYINRSNLSIIGGNIIKKVTAHENREMSIEFSKPLPKGFSANNLLANATKTASLHFANNTVKNIRARGILFQSRGALIENNTFDSTTGTGILIDTATGWMESTGTQDVIIRNNVIKSSGYGDGTYRNASGIAVLTESNQSISGVHKNLTIEGNRIEGVGNRGIYVCCSDNVQIKNNVINNSKPKIFTENTTNLTLINNTGSDSTSR
tara:strand:+ start:907 stop:2613 length:1707 start_codon:yes stop_codon:yes gene_type:complete